MIYINYFTQLKVCDKLHNKWIKVKVTPGISSGPWGQPAHSFAGWCQNNMRASGTIVVPRLGMKFPTKQTTFAQPWRQKNKT